MAVTVRFFGPALLMAYLLISQACGWRDDQRTVIAATQEWTVVAVDPLDRADVRNTFEVFRRGEPYAAHGYLHFDSDSFNDEYPIRAWVAPNALRIGNEELQRAAHQILLRNEASSPIRWMRVGSFEFFLVFDVPPGASVTLPCARFHGDYGFSAEGQFLDGREIPRTPAMQADGPPRPVTVIVTDSGASMSIKSS